MVRHLAWAGDFCGGEDCQAWGGRVLLKKERLRWAALQPGTGKERLR